MSPSSSFSFSLSPEQAANLEKLLRTGNYRPASVPHTRIAADGPDCRICLYKTGTCLVQGQGGEDFVLFVLEPNILQQARIGYEAVLNPEADQPHIGVDESGKGDFLGPMVIAAAYVDSTVAPALRAARVRDSKRITSDAAAETLARSIRGILGDRWSLVTIGPRAYNRLYAKMRNVNRLLAWGHARGIEDVLEKVPDCPRAVSDQFGPARQVQQALMKRGRRIELIQQPRAESDLAVAAASVLARAAFVAALRDLEKRYGQPFPKGASDRVREAAAALARQHGPAVLLETAKCHFKTTDAVLGALKVDRSVLGPDGKATSKPSSRPAGDAANQSSSP